MRSHQLIYKRKKDTPAIRLTGRDRRILETIHAFDGMMSLKQIDRLFFSGNGGTWPRERMRALSNHGYVYTPGTSEIHRVPLGETVYTLDVKGAEIVAGLHGQLVKDLSWRKKPRWSLISHDLAVNDFRIDVMLAAQASPDLTLHRWIPEREFWAKPDKVRYRSANGVSKTRRVRPDGFFTIRRPVADHPGAFEELAFLLEIDMGTEDNPRFAREKVRPGFAYLKSSAYRERFGLDYGRWLVVTTGERRLANMKAQTERSGGSGLFYFTTFSQVSQDTLCTQSIWRLAGSDETSNIVPASNWPVKDEQIRPRQPDRWRPGSVQTPAVP